MEAHLAELGRWISRLRHDDVPADVRRAARYQILDMVAAAHAAMRADEVAPVLRALARLAPAGRSTVIATSAKHGPTDAALANAACSMAQDFDDIVWMGHTCHSAVFASLAVAEHEGRETSDLVTAVVAANEVAGRIGASSFVGPLNGQMWTFIHLVGAAAASSKLLGLDAEQTTHALAIALAQPNFALQPGFLLPGSKLLAAATPTATGIQAAFFAREGLTGFPAILEDRRGFWRRFSYLPLPVMLEGLGDLWVLRTLAMKTYPGCHYFQTALSAIDRIRARWPDLRAEHVRCVRIETTKLACEATRFASEYVAQGGLTPVAVAFDLALAAALLLHSGALSCAEIDREHLREHEAALRRIAARIEVRHDPALSARVVAGARAIGAGRAAIRSVGVRDLVHLARRYGEDYRSTLASPAEAIRFAAALSRELRRQRRSRAVDARDVAIALPFPSRVTLERDDGRIAVEEIDVPVGALSEPGVEHELERKMVRETCAALGEPRARAAFAAGLRLEEQSLEDFVASISATATAAESARRVQASG